MCSLNNVRYKAKVSSTKDSNKTYIGLTKKIFKPRHKEHKASFPKYFKSKSINCTQFANYLWDLNSNNIKYSVEFKIVEFLKSISNHTNICTLCNQKTFCTALANKRKTLNERNELISQGLHYFNEHL